MKKHPQFVAANVSFEPLLKVRDSTETQAAKNEEAPVDDCAILISGRRILDASRTSPNTRTHTDQQILAAHTHNTIILLLQLLLLLRTLFHNLQMWKWHQNHVV